MKHNIVLKGYGAYLPTTPSKLLCLGTAESYGVEKIHITPGADWENLLIKATFHPPSGDSVVMLLGDDGIIDVPPEATAVAAGEYNPGLIVFSGISDGVQRISADIAYTVLGHAPVDGKDSEPTPNQWEQLAAQYQSKVDKQQGAENAGKVLGIGEDGMVKPVEQGGGGGAGNNGATFIPSVDDDGLISWTNDGDLPNPEPVNIKGAPGKPGDNYVLTEADKQEIAQEAANKVKIPDKLPNPNALTFSGAVTGTYDGSTPLMVNIPSGGEGGNGDGGLSLYETGLVAYDGTKYNSYPIDLENYSWNHLAGTKRIAPLAEKATSFTTEGATAHEANAVGFGANWILLQWVQNTVGTTVDAGDANGSCEIQGKLMYWRFGFDYPLAGESPAFTISKKGDSLTRTIAGDTIAASGGVGICNVANKDSKTVYSIATYYHNAKHIPTTKVISIDDTGYTTTYDGKLTIGVPVVWTITKDGVTSDWDDTILGTEQGGHVNCQIYCDYASTGYNYYMAVVRPNKGVSVITSTDCTNWTWIADVDIPVENTAYIESALTKYQKRWYLAVRCKDGRLWVAKLLDDYSVNWNFFMPDCGSKPQFVSMPKRLMLACAPQSRYSCRLYRFTTATKDLSNSACPDRLEAVGDITYNACNYPFFCGNKGTPGYNNTYNYGDSWLIVGTNNFATNKLGCSYFIDKPFGNYQYPNEAVNELAKAPTVEMKTLTFTGAVSASYNGTGDVTVEIPKADSGGSSGGYVVDTLIDTTLTEEAKYVDATIDSRSYRKFYAYIKNVGTATNTNANGSIALVANPTAANSQGFALSMSVSNCNTADAAAFVDITVDLYNSCSYSCAYLAKSNAGTQGGYSSMMTTRAGCETVFNTLRVQFNNQWHTFGVGTEIKVFGVRV